jgi:hypothetical protein
VPKRAWRGTKQLASWTPRRTRQDGGRQTDKKVIRQIDGLMDRERIRKQRQEIRKNKDIHKEHETDNRDQRIMKREY